MTEEQSSFRQIFCSKEQPYRDFSGHTFTGEEKRILCELLDSKITSTNELIQNYRINKMSLYLWLKDYKNGKELKDLGRPKYLDQVSEWELGGMILSANQEKRPLSPSKSHSLSLKLEKLRARIHEHHILGFL